MKKFIKITVDICILFVIGLLLYYFITQAQGLKLWHDELNYYKDWLQSKIENPNLSGNSIEFIQAQISDCNHAIAVNSVLLVVQFFALAACVFLFVYCNPCLFRISTWTNLSEEWTKNKAERAARKQAKSETDKQKRIEELQKELDALKKDDAPPSQE